MASAAFQERLDRVGVKRGLLNTGIDLGVMVPIALGRDMAVYSCKKLKAAMSGRVRS